MNQFYGFEEDDFKYTFYTTPKLSFGEFTEIRKDNIKALEVVFKGPWLSISVKTYENSLIEFCREFKTRAEMVGFVRNSIDTTGFNQFYMEK